MPEKKLKLIQAGCGGMGRTWWKGAVRESADFEVVGLVDVADEPLVEAGEALGVPVVRRFRSLEAALDGVEADAVLTVTPPAVHVEHARLVFGRGLHLLTEKPIAPKMEEAQEMVALAGRAGKQLVVAQNYRFSPGARRLKQLVAETPVGEVGHGHLDFYIPGDFAASFRGTMAYPLMVDMAIHHFDLIRAVTGKNIVRVMAQSFRPSWSWYQHEPALKMLMELEGSTMFSYSGDWAAYGKTTTWNGDWRLQCERGSIEWAGDKLGVWRSGFWGKDQVGEEVSIPSLELVAQGKLLADFAAAIRTGVPAETSGEDNLWSLGVVMAGVKSAQERRWVAVSEVLGG